MITLYGDRKRIQARAGLSAQCMLGYIPPREQNHRRLRKHSLAATTLRTVTIIESAIKEINQIPIFYRNVTTAKNDVRHNQTVLFIAARNKNLKNVNTLLDHGADVNVKDSMNETPLFPAVELGCYDMVKRLVEVSEV